MASAAPDPDVLSLEIGAIMDRLNSAVLEAKKLGNRRAFDALSAAWSSAYDARAAIEAA